MDLFSLLDRSSTLIIKLGMPIVYLYHLIISSTFFNIAAEDAQGLERIANQLLIPYQYLFEGRVACPDSVALDGMRHYHFERRFEYNDHFYMKSVAAATMLPFSVVVGGTVKAIAYLTEEGKDHYHALISSLFSDEVHSNNAFYASIGITPTAVADMVPINPPKHKRREGEGDKLLNETNALRAIVKLLDQNRIPFWLDCGSCLGAYRYGGTIPWDWDIDIGVLKQDFERVRHALNGLDPDKYSVQDWSGRDRPSTYLKVFVKENNSIIDLYHFDVDPQTRTIHTVLSNEFNIFLPASWKIRELRYTVPMPIERIFPLKRANFEGIDVPVPGKIEEYLQTFYGKNLAPARIYNEATGEYEKDLSHPYWQLPHAH